MRARGSAALCIVLAILGWVALGSFTYHNPPDGWNRWLATAILGPTLWATFLPLVHLLHKGLKREGNVIPAATRQSAFAAFFVTLCVGLRFVAALTWANATLVLALFVLAEVLLSAKQPQ